MKKKGLHIAFYGLVLLLAVPALQLQFGLFREKPLNGAFTLAEKPVFSKETWMDGSFQRNVEQYLKDNSGFRNFMVRFQNQLDYILFRQANAQGVVIGKNGQLFEYDYIRSWLALDYPGDSFVEKKLTRAAYVKEFLKKEKNIDLVIVFEPGKASFYPEYIPDEYSGEKSGPSTYERYRNKAIEIGLGFTDLQEYFMQLKPDAQYPLFPPYGTHWSVYGMKYAADSMLKLIEEERGIRFSGYGYGTDTPETSKKPRDTDDDVLKTMNLLFPMKGKTLAYPAFSFGTTDQEEKPMVLTVADSYYWNIFNTGIPRELFDNEAFWYFNTLVYPDHYLKPTFTNDLNIREEVEKQDVIFLMVTERFVHKFDWRFTDQLFHLYAPGWMNDPVYDKINDIMQLETWYEEMIEKSQNTGLSLEQVLINEGKFLYHREDTTGYLLEYGMEHYSRMISADSGWMAHVREKARAKNISDEEMLRNDAAYMFNLEHPGLFSIHNAWNETINKLTADPAAMDRLKSEAARNHLDFERYLRHEAWVLYKNEELLKTREAILSNPGWYRDVKQKAAEKGIPVDQMIKLDAIYLFDQKHSQFNL